MPINQQQTWSDQLQKSHLHLETSRASVCIRSYLSHLPPLVTHTHTHCHIYCLSVRLHREINLNWIKLNYDSILSCFVAESNYFKTDQVCNTAIELNIDIDSKWVLSTNVLQLNWVSWWINTELNHTELNQKWTESTQNWSKVNWINTEFTLNRINSELNQQRTKSTVNWINRTESIQNWISTEMNQ